MARVRRPSLDPDPSPNLPGEPEPGDFEFYHVTTWQLGHWDVNDYVVPRRTLRRIRKKPFGFGFRAPE